MTDTQSGPRRANFLQVCTCSSTGSVQHVNPACPIHGKPPEFVTTYSGLQPLDVEALARVIAQHRHKSSYGRCSCGEPTYDLPVWETHLAEAIVSHFGQTQK